jgi:hypothetical protein
MHYVLDNSTKMPYRSGMETFSITKDRKMKNYLDNLRPIDEHPLSDDFVQPEVILETENALFFYGEWGPDAGYFFVDGMLFEPETPDQIAAVRRMEMPGRLYMRPVRFTYTGN